MNYNKKIFKEPLLKKTKKSYIKYLLMLQNWFHNSALQRFMVEFLFLHGKDSEVCEIVKHEVTWAIFLL